MDKQIASLMTRSVVTVDIDDTVESIERVLREGAFAFAPVLGRQGECFGVISASDIVQFHSRQENTKLRRAWEICTHQVIEVPPNTPLQKVARLMLDKHVHHVVVTEAGRVTGVLSSLDLIDHFVVTCDT
ncbi:MAG: CBS domain-containing protein [Gammaproteobacteria bacterium]|nr:CBS domain-containing protein [Gammaproteobacteria bacterium]